MKHLIRNATEKDLGQVTDIYANEVINGTASYELDPPGLEEMTSRFEALKLKQFPYLVAELDDQIAGYAYFGPFRPRPAYKWTVENSVYVSPTSQGKGVGKALLSRLIALAEQSGYRQMIAIVGDPENLGSIALHKSCGFETIGIQKSVGWKHGRWLDCVMMQLELGHGASSPALPISNS